MNNQLCFRSFRNAKRKKQKLQEEQKLHEEQKFKEVVMQAENRCDDDDEETNRVNDKILAIR